jgi:SNF2 family DNA or RNA helicase
MIKLQKHQSEDLIRSQTEPRWGFWNDPGTGKTILSLAIVADQKARGFVGKTVVLAPKSILWSAWAKDAEHFPELKVVVCYATSAAKRRKLLQTPDADVLVMNYETFKMFYRPEDKRKGTPEVDELSPVGVKRMIVDESSKLRNHSSQISKAAYRFSQKIKSCYLLSGTPAPNGYTDWFGQFRCIDPSILGPSFWAYANTYGGPLRRMIGGREITIGWKLHKCNEANLLAMLRSKSSVRKIEDCVDIPEQTDEIRHVDLSPPELHAYVQILQQLQHEFDDGEITQVTANSKSMKLRQITGGNIYVGDGMAREVGDSKLQALNELLEELGERKVVIWAEFTAEIDRIVRDLKDSGYAAEKIDGSIEVMQRARHIENFQTGKLQYLVCHPAAAGHGVTLTAARYDVFYSLGFFPENYDQARARIRRIGQVWPVVHYHLIAQNTVDERVLKVVKGKQTAAEAIKELLADAGRRRMAEVG